MENVQMNIRIPVATKRKGDEVAARYGKTASDIARAVWSYMAAHGTLPACAQEAPPDDALAQAQRRAELVVANASLVSDFLAELENTGKSARAANAANEDFATQTPYYKLQDALYDELLEAYMALEKPEELEKVEGVKASQREAIYSQIEVQHA